MNPKNPFFMVNQSKINNNSILTIDNNIDIISVPNNTLLNETTLINITQNDDKSIITDKIIDSTNLRELINI